MTLRDLPVGSTGIVLTVGGKGALRQHFLDMGVIPGVEMTLIKFAPMGDPIEFRIHGYELTLRKHDAEKIEIKLLTEEETEKVKNEAIENGEQEEAEEEDEED